MKRFRNENGGPAGGINADRVRIVRRGRGHGAIGAISGLRLRHHRRGRVTILSLPRHQPAGGNLGHGNQIGNRSVRGSSAGTADGNAVIGRHVIRGESDPVAAGGVNNGGRFLPFTVVPGPQPASGEMLNV